MLDINTLVTGVVVNGFTAPTYTLTADEKPSLNARQSIVTALGGTQTNVRSHSPTDPFIVTVAKPPQVLSMPQVPLNGVLGKVGRNKGSLVVRKGVNVIAGQPPQVAEFRFDRMIPAGAEVIDVANIAAIYSFMIALLTREKDNLLLADKLGTT